MEPAIATAICPFAAFSTEPATRLPRSRDPPLLPGRPTRRHFGDRPTIPGDASSNSGRGADTAAVRSVDRVPSLDAGRPGTLALFELPLSGAQGTGQFGDLGTPEDHQNNHHQNDQALLSED